MSSCDIEIDSHDPKMYNSQLLAFDSSFSKGILSQPIKISEMNEASGIAASQKYPGFYYVENDSGNPANVFMIDSAGQLAGTIHLRGVDNRDWEDISVGKGSTQVVSYIYIADIGDNHKAHENYFIYRLQEPDVLPDTQKPFQYYADNPEKAKFQYPKQKSHNAEAFMVSPDGTRFYVITKGKKADVYELNLFSGEKVKTNWITSLPINKVTGGDISANGEILIRNYTTVFLWKNKNNVALDSLLKSVPVETSYTLEPQGEAVCWSLDEKFYFTLSEINYGMKQYLIRYQRKNLDSKAK